MRMSEFYHALRVSKRLRSVNRHATIEVKLPHAFRFAFDHRFPALDPAYDLGPAGRTASVALARFPACSARNRLCRSRAWLGATVPDCIVRRCAGRRDADLSQVPFVWGVRVRLGMGRCLSPARSPVLPEAGRRHTVHTCDGAAPHRRRPGNARPSAPGGARIRRRTNDCRRCTSCFRKQAKPRSARQPD